MLQNISLDHILFLDIETVPQQPTFKTLSESGKNHWIRKAENLKKSETETPADLYNRAGIYAEFGKIICISAGVFSLQDNQRIFRIKSFYGDDEVALLTSFAELLNQHFNKAHHLLCAHNGKEFDFPYLSRRMLINGIRLPSILNTATKKPWEVQHLDTMELWKFGDYKSYTSLKLLAKVLGIPSPKDDIDGSMVNEVYYVQKDIDRIVEYCQKDVITLTNVLLRFHCEELIKPANIEFKNLRKADV